MACSPIPTLMPYYNVPTEQYLLLSGQQGQIQEGYLHA